MHELAVCHVSGKYSSTVGFVEQYDDGVLLARVENPLADQHLGDAVQLTVLDPVRGECRYDGLLGGLGDDHVSVVVRDLVSQQQRRSAARAYCEIACIAALEDATGDLDGAARITVVDVSASGIRFATTTSLAVGDVVRLTLPVDPGAVDLRARVLRVEEATWGWRYGCELLDLTEPTRDALFRLVLRLQREEIQARSAR